MSVSASEKRVEGTTYNLLFVCSGNTCRSPMAEAIARDLLRRRGWAHVDARSAGTSTVPGVAATEDAVAVAREYGLDLEQHASQPLTPELIDWADLILTMGTSHAYVVAELGGSEKVALVTDFLEGENAGQPVEDPFGGDRERYHDAFVQLEAAVLALLDRLKPILSP